MRWMKGRCGCGKDHLNINLYGFDWIIVGLIIGAILCFPLGCTYGIAKQQMVEMKAWEDGR